MKQKILLVITFVSLTNLSISQTNQNLTNDLNSYLDLIEASGFSGQVLVKKGDFYLNRSLGFTDFSESTQITDTTLFGIASTSKQFTAAAILLLAQQGKLNINESISRYLKEVPLSKQSITIHHLLTHSSGIPGGDLIEDFELISKEEVANRIFSTPLEFEPGTSWRYSNAGYNLLALVIEAVSKQSFEVFLRKKLFEPYGLENTIVAGSKKIVDVEFASSLKGSIDYGSPGQWKYNIRTLGGGNIFSTVTDLNRWFQVLRNNKFLKKEYIKLMFSPQIQVHKDEWYGYGWFVFKDSEASIRMIEHGGDYEKGYNCAFHYFPQKEVTIIILNNRQQNIGLNFSERWAIYYPIRDMVFGKSADVEIKEVVRNTKLKLNNSAQVSIAYPTPDSILVSLQKAHSRTEALIEQLLLNDLQAYADVLGERAVAAPDFNMEWEDIQKVYGRVMHYEVIGTIHNYYNDGVICHVKFYHERGSSFMAYGWMDHGNGRLYATFPKNEFSIEFNVLEDDEGFFWRYDLFRNKWVNVTELMK